MGASALDTGGISSGTSFLLYNNTIYNNKTVYCNNLPSTTVGAIKHDDFLKHMYLANNIISTSIITERANIPDITTKVVIDPLQRNCTGLVISLGNNIHYSHYQYEPCTFNHTIDFILNPELGELTGTVPSLPLLASSPAINAGNSDICNGSLVGGRDGCGAKRPPVNCDIGAYEYGSETAEFPDTIGVFRPTNGITYFKNELTTGFADIAIVYGIAGDKPVAGVWQFSGADQADAPEQPSLAPTFVPRQ